MHASILRAPLACLLGLVLAAGCGDSGGTVGADAAMHLDAAGQEDGPPADAAPDDVVAPQDASGRPDVPKPHDAPAPADAGPPDVGPKLDGPEADAAPAADAVVATDATDAAVAADAGTAGDAAPGTDGGVTPGETCQAAVAVGAGTVAGSTVGFRDDYGGADGTGNCYAGSDIGRDRVYELVIPAGQTLTATVSPEPTYDVAVYLLPAPPSTCAAATTCLAGADRFIAGGDEQITYRNDTGADLAVFVIVDGEVAGSAGAYTLTTALATP
ncbi:MAG TPA: hypothetical protein VGQ83_22310 [Polyangia bacterium]|jgi:hypothetical protein